MFLIDKDEALFMGLIQNSSTVVGGAGRHLRAWARKVSLCHNEYDSMNGKRRLLDDAKKIFETKTKCRLPWNFSSVHHTGDIEDVARWAGWIRSAVHYPLAVKTVALCMSQRGWGSPATRMTMRELHCLWTTPSTISVNQYEGLRWWLKRKPVSGYKPLPVVKNKKFFELLGKLSGRLRWAAISGMGSLEAVTHRDLDWGAVDRAQSNDRFAASYMPKKGATKWLWQQTHGAVPSITTAMNINPFSVKKKGLVFALSQFEGQSLTLTENVDAAVRLALLFGNNVVAMRTWAQHYGSWHDAGTVLPATQLKLRCWATLLAKAPAKMLSVVHAIEQLDGNEAFASNQTADNAVELARRVYSVASLTENEKQFLATAINKKWEGCPHVLICDGQYVLEKVASNSYQNLTAGRETHCCQHLGGAARSCAISAWEQGDCAIYAVYKNGAMVAQSFAWRNTSGKKLVFDSVECLGDNSTVVSLFVKAAQQIVGRLGIEKVCVGDSNYGITVAVASAGGKMVAKPTPAFNLGYSDVRNHVTILASMKPVVKAIASPKPVPVQVCDTAVNELSDDSDVYCEHCGAQVHLACEICPSCNANIAEWV